MPTSLIQQKCVPCEGNVKPFNPQQIAIYLPQIPEWKINNRGRIERTIKNKNFAETLKLLNKIGEIAEKEGHHPDLYLHSWNKLTITLWTHAIKGLFLNDFILAAKIDDLLKPY